MEDKSKLGTVIHGIAASEHIDSSGEILSIEGMDISSLGSADSIFNFEHNSKENPAQVVGKVTFAKKIFKKSDCSNQHEEYFWDFCKKPFVYIKGELFDHPDLDHDGARNVAALLRYDNRDKGEKSRHLISFSIEGGKMDKKGMVVTKSIARDVAITIKHCNKMCIVEIFDDIKQRKDLYKHNQEVPNLLKTDVSKHGYRHMVLEDIKKSFSNMDSFANKIAKIKGSTSLKQKTKASSQLGNMATQPPGQEFAARPKRQFIDSKAPKQLQVGDRLLHSSKTGVSGKKLYNDPSTFATASVAPKQPNPGLKTGISGKDLYNNPDTFKPEAPQQKQQLTPASKPKTDMGINKNTWTPENNMRKALIAGMMGGSPDSKIGMAALTPEHIEPTLQKPFQSKKQRKFAHANPEKFGGKEGIKEWESKTPKNIPEKVKKNENEGVKHFFHQPHSMFSVENPYHPTKHKVNHQKMLQRLQQKGFDVEHLNGKYGNKENSIVVKNPTPKQQLYINKLAQKLGQDSVIHSDGKSHKMLYLNGEKANQYHVGSGTQVHSQEPEDFYSTSSSGIHFTHNFDFDKLHKREEPLIKMSQPRLKFPQLGADSDPRMDVKHIDPDKTYQTKDGKTFTQGEIERKKMTQKYKHALSPANREDKELQQYAQDFGNKVAQKEPGYVTHGEHISSPTLGVSQSYSYTSSPNLKTTQAHEALHGTLSKLKSHPKVGEKHTEYIVNHMLDTHFDPDDLNLVSGFIGGRGYSPKNKEESLTHILDLISNPKKRGEFAKYVAQTQPGGAEKELGSQQIIHNDIMGRLKSGWKKTVEFANKLDLDTLKKLRKRNKKNLINPNKNNKNKKQGNL